MQSERLIGEARRARERAYAPYSGYPVGAAVETASGKVFTGCNVENASTGLTVCAERTAVQKAVSEGERNIAAIAVVTANQAPPCGACRQVLAEFVEDCPVYLADPSGAHRETSLAALLPQPFRGETGNG